MIFPSGLWAPELLHSQSQDFFSGGVQNELQSDVHDRDIEVQEAARLLMTCKDMFNEDSREEKQEERRRRGHGKQIVQQG